MPRLKKNMDDKNILSIESQADKNENVIENNVISNNDELFTMQIVLKPTFASAFQTLTLINSRGITGYDIFPTMNKGMKYQIVYHKKVTKKQAKELFEKVEDFGEFNLKLI